MFRKSKNEICKIAIQQHPSSLFHVKNQTEEICKIFIMQNPHALQYVKNQTRKICIFTLNVYRGNDLNFIFAYIRDDKLKKEIYDTYN